MRFFGPFLLSCTLGLALLPGVASARTVEPGAITVSGGVGPGFRLGSRLGGSGAYLKLLGQGEYNLTSAWSVLGSVELGLAGTVPLQLYLGGRYRMVGLDLPISPYAQAQLTFGKLYDVIGETDLSTIGVRAGAGADYFLTAKFGVGGLLALNLGSTLADRKAFYGTFDVIAYATYTF